VYRHTFTDGISITNFDAGHTAVPFKVLGFQAQRGKGKNLVFATQPSVAADDNVRIQAAALAQFHVLVDDTVGPNLAARTDAGLGVNYSRRVNHTSDIRIQYQIALHPWLFFRPEPSGPTRPMSGCERFI